MLTCYVSGQDNPSQNTFLRNIYIETGMDFVGCTPPEEKDYIRGDVIPDPYYYETSYIRALLYKNFVGVKYEKRVLQNKVGLTAGVRFTWMHSSIGKNSYWGSGSDYYYFLYQEQGTKTEFLRVKDITQSATYIGIPFEIRIYPYEERTVQMYYKIGFDLNRLMTAHTKVSFENKLMDSYEQGIEQIIEEPLSYYATAYAAIGMKIGKSDKPGVNLEACIPAVIICNYDAAFVKPTAGGGFQINLRIPLK